MKKNKVIIISVFIVLSMLFVSTSASAYAPDRIERIYQEVSYHGNSKFYSTTAHQRYYRGYLPYQGTGLAGVFHIYEGYLYRDDLPYPIYD